MEKMIRLDTREAEVWRMAEACAGTVTGASSAGMEGDLRLQRSEQDVRRILHTLDLVQCLWDGHEEGVRRQLRARAGDCNVDAEMFQRFRGEMQAAMGESFTFQDVTALKSRLKDFVRSVKTPASRILYIADCHFFHRRLNTEMDKRGFASGEEMNEHMIRRWNEKVTSKDDVYILGDFSLAPGPQTSGIYSRLNGKKHLIIGNHDRYLEDRDFEYDLLASRDHVLEIRDHGKSVILSHYPIFCYRGQYKRDRNGNPAVYMLYGHVHNTHDERLVHRFIMETRATKVLNRHTGEMEPIPCNMINCFCMFGDYQPLTLDEWIRRDRKRRQQMNAEEDAGEGKFTRDEDEEDG